MIIEENKARHRKAVTIYSLSQVETRNESSPENTLVISVHWEV